MERILKRRENLHRKPQVKMPTIVLRKTRQSFIATLIGVGRLWGKKLQKQPGFLSQEKWQDLSQCTQYRGGASSW